MFEELSGTATLLRPSWEARPRGHIRQAGAICYRWNDKDRLVETLLIASLRNGRWGIPKGHVESGETTRQAARREAFEESGVSGIVDKDVFGAFTYSKEGNPKQFHVSVHLLAVKELADNFPEKQVRKIRWVPVGTAMRDTWQSGLSGLFVNLFYKTADEFLAEK
ncbi:NUDIX hydrolase [Rhizobium sp. 2YAF20]|uniref:NUDIX hydrolase n=1 Tax=Rhizobium sp. 2YAF20 TaxID=3233027 RepID=UPI003F9B9C27